MVWFAPYEQIGIVFTLNNNNNNISVPTSNAACDNVIMPRNSWRTLMRDNECASAEWQALSNGNDAVVLRLIAKWTHFEMSCKLCFAKKNKYFTIRNSFRNEFISLWGVTVALRNSSLFQNINSYELVYSLKNFRFRLNLGRSSMVYNGIIWATETRIWPKTNNIMKIFVTRSPINL